MLSSSGSADGADRWEGFRACQICLSESPYEDAIEYVDASINDYTTAEESTPPARDTELPSALLREENLFPLLPQAWASGVAADSWQLTTNSRRLG